MQVQVYVCTRACLYMWRPEVKFSSHSLGTAHVDGGLIFSFFGMYMHEWWVVYMCCVCACPCVGICMVHMCMQIYTMCMCVGRRWVSGVFFNFSPYLLSQGHHLKPELSDLASLAYWLSPGIFCLHLVHAEIKGRLPHLLGTYVKGLKFPRILFPCLPSTGSLCTHHVFSFCVGSGVLEGK